VPSNVAALTKTEAPFPFSPFEDICVIEQLTEEKTAGGILLVGKEKDFPSGRVVAAGPGRVYSNFLDASGEHKIGHFVPNPVKVGSYVIFGRFLSGGDAVTIEGKNYLLARAGDMAGYSTDGKPLKIKLAKPVE
jgi:co-chaperonin GroES (HSP10)